MSESARFCVEVVAGLVPGKDPLPELTKQVWCTSKEWYSSTDKDALLQSKIDEAWEHARDLMDPSSLNWVRIDWVWF